MPDHTGEALQEAIAVMDTLRSEGGCPWDREQTHASLAPYAVEEAHEVAEAAETGHREELIEELGDLLLQVLFHARVGAEGSLGEPFDLEDVAATLVAKLRRRHPHVFAGSQTRTSAEVTARWEVIKAQEKQRESVLDGIPVSLPALARAQKMLSRAERAGIEITADAMVAGSTADSTAAERAARADVDPAGARRAGAAHSGTAPGSPGPAGPDPAGLDHAGPEPASSEPASLDHAGPDPASSEPASLDHASPDPAEQIGAELVEVVRRAQAAGVDAEAALRHRARVLDRQVRAAEQQSAAGRVPPSSE